MGMVNGHDHWGTTDDPAEQLRANATFAELKAIIALTAALLCSNLAWSADPGWQAGAWAVAMTLAVVVTVRQTMQAATDRAALAMSQFLKTVAAENAGRVK